MKTRVKLIALLSPLLLALTGGCTAILWENDDLEAWNQASKPNVRLFETSPETNLLVLYNEFSERNDRVRTRAYWLEQNQKAVAERTRPHFIRGRTLRNLPAVPVFSEPMPDRALFPTGLCAVVAADRQTFTLYMDHRPVLTNNLPIYNDGKGRVEKIALTPLAVTADLSVVGGVAAVCVAYAYAEGEGSSDNSSWHH